MIRSGAISLLVFALGALSPGHAGTVNFDEFTSPPVTCCFGSTGVTGPLVYPNVTITDGSNLGFVMNNTGWDDMQTSGSNLFGTESGSIRLTFNTSVSNLALDLINGFGAATFTLSTFDLSDSLLSSQTPSLTDFGSVGSVEHITFNDSGIGRLEIDGNGDFAIDTISFDTTAVPEPASLVLFPTALSIVCLLRLRRRVS